MRSCHGPGLWRPSKHGIMLIGVSPAGRWVRPAHPVPDIIMQVGAPAFVVIAHRDGHTGDAFGQPGGQRPAGLVTDTTVMSGSGGAAVVCIMPRCTRCK